MDNGQFTDAFAPWDVHVYTTDAALANTALAKLLPAYVEAYSMAGTVHPTRDANLALYLHGSRASASSTNRWARANAAINGSYATVWRADKREDQHWLAVDFRRQVTVGRVVLVTGAQPDGRPEYEDGSWSLELRGDAGWTAIEQARRSYCFVHWSPELNRWERADRPSARPRRAEVYRFGPRATTAVRFVCRAPRSRPAAYEVEAYGE